MESKIMQVFYGADCLPYKDKERQVHYPVVGNSFTGASDTTKIRFYVKDIGGVENVTWVAVVKLPNGKIGFKVLSAIGNDLDVGERYIEFSLNSFYTQYNGDLAIALKGYQGNIKVEEDEETGIYEIVGTPTIQATGVIKLSVNYSTQLPVTETFSPDQIIQLMALIAEKLNIASGIVVLLNDEEDISGYTNGQLFYVVSRNQFMQLVENELEEKELKVYDLVPGQQVTMSIIANTLTNVNGRVLSAYESQIVIVNDFQCYKITRGGENLTEEYASRYMEIMTGSKYLPKYDYEHPQNTYFITPSGLILKPQYDSTNGLLLYPMSNLATRDYVNNDILEITDTSTPLTYEQRQKILTNNVRIKYNNFYYEKVNHLGHNVRFECADLLFTTNADGSTTISKRFIVARDDTGSISANTRELVAYSKAQADQYFANSVEMSVDSNYVLKVKLIDKNGNQLAEDSVDLPLESIIQSAQYYETYTYQGTTYEDVIVITLATTDVPTIIPVGDLVSGLVSETTFNQGMATKIDKTNVANKVYGTNGSGSQTTFNVDNNVSGNVVRRDSNSQIKVPLAPTNNDDATSKGYVDTFAKDVALSLDQSTYVLTVTLKNASGGNIVSRTVDLPLETMVVSGSYDSVNQAIILTLKNGQTISIPVGDLISGLVSTDYLQANYYNKTQIDQMVSGFVFADVDDHLSSVSTNPVENRVITQALEEKANVDGNYPTMTVGVADNLSPYDESSGADQDTPFILQATGTGNDTQPDFSTGAIALMKEKRGNSVVVNQLARPLNATYWTYYQGTPIFNDGICELTPSAGAQYPGISQHSLSPVNGHKFLIMVDFKGDTTLNLNFGGFDGQIASNLNPSNWNHIVKLVSANTSSYYISFFVLNGTNTQYYKNIKVIDLTKWFNGDIPQDLLDHPENFFRYYQGSLAYNEGTLVNANGRYIKCIGMNQWDEEWEKGNFNTTTGVNDSGDGIRSKNLIKVIPGADYYGFIETSGASKDIWCMFYDKDQNVIQLQASVYTYENVMNFTNQHHSIPSNACYMKFYITVAYGNVYNHDITISLYYSGESGYDQYYPYEVLTNNDTGVEVLRSAGSVKDIKLPSGEIKRNVGVVDLGECSFSAGGDTHTFMLRLNDMNNSYGRYNFVCAKFENVGETTYALYTDKGNLKVAKESGGHILYFSYEDASTPADFKTAMSGVYLFYELAEPTTEQGTPYSENLVIDDFGSMDFDSDVPQGALIFYPVDYKAFVDTLYKYTDGTPSNIALKSDLPTVPQTWAESLPGYDATKTQTLKNVEGTLTWVTEGE